MHLPDTAVGGYTMWGRKGNAGGVDPLAGRKMLAVLPLENRGASADEYFADGLSEAIAARLGSVRRLGVIAWQSARQYKGTQKSPQEIGRELGAQYVVEGTVRWERPRDGPSRIRVTPALIRVSDGAQLWAEEYDTIPAGVFAIQANLATRVAGALDIALGDAERHLLEARPTANLEAYDAYLRGREAPPKARRRLRAKGAGHGRFHRRSLDLSSDGSDAGRQLLSACYNFFLHRRHLGFVAR